MQNYEVIAIIGEGSFGRVYKGKEKNTGDVVALKLINKCGKTTKAITGLRREFEILQQLDHPNIIRMIESFETESEIVVVTEFAYRDLYEILAKEGFLSEERARKIVCDLVSALYYLHSNRVLHRDLKPHNVLLTTSGTAKLCDFGFARNMSIGTHVLTSIKGTPLYMAPELMEESPYDHNADLWSLGCITYEMLVGTPPFTTTSILHLVKLIRFVPIKWPSFISPECQSFLRGLLNKDPKQRLSWPHLLHHEFIKDNVFILNSEAAPIPLTSELTISQAKAKEIQTQKIIKTAQVMRQPQADNLDDIVAPRRLSGAPDLEREMRNLRLSPKKDQNILEEEWKKAIEWEDNPSSPIDPEEWLVFLQQSMEEIMSGDFESISQPVFVRMVSRALSSGSSKVINYVANIYSLPIVVEGVTNQERENICKVYLETHVVPKLLYGSKLLVDQTTENLTAEELQALEELFLLVANLVHREGKKFLEQFYSSVSATIAMRAHMTRILTLRKRKIRLATDLVGVLVHLLRLFPERSNLVGEIIIGFENPESELRGMLTHSNDSLRARALALLKLMGNQCLGILEPIWSPGLQNDIEALTYDSSQTVRRTAECTASVIRKLPFYIRDNEDKPS